MKIFDNSNFLSQLIGFSFLILFAYKLTDILLLIIPRQYQNGFITVLFYVLSYLVLMKTYELLYRLILILSYYNQRRIFTVILLLVLLPVNIELSIKSLKMLYYARAENDYDKIIKYFDDNNDSVKYYALLLYGAQIDTAHVLNWFEEKYIRKGIPIDSDVFPLYEYFVSDKNA